MEEIIQWILEKKNICIFTVLLVVAVSFGGLYAYEVTAEESFSCPVSDSIDVSESVDELVIDMKGAVVNPGVYRVKKGTIIQEAIELAGGLTSDANTSNLNLSKAVTNEMVIQVFTNQEIEDMNLEKEPIIEEESDSSDNSSMVSLNKASLEELMTLPGVGEAKAKLIIEYREKCGSFKSIEELKNIKGIGDAMYEKMLPYLTL